jgi:hypothetical protein
MMEWWYQSAEERMSAPTVYPPPPPPPAPKVYSLLYTKLRASTIHLQLGLPVGFASIMYFSVGSVFLQPNIYEFNLRDLVHVLGYSLIWVSVIFIRLPKTEFPCHLTGRFAPYAARSAITLLFFLFLVLFFATAAYLSLYLRWGFYHIKCLPNIFHLNYLSIIS